MAGDRIVLTFMRWLAVAALGCFLGLPIVAAVLTDFAIAPDLGRQLKAVRYAPIAVVVLAYLGVLLLRRVGAIPSPTEAQRSRLAAAANQKSNRSDVIIATVGMIVLIVISMAGVRAVGDQSHAGKLISDITPSVLAMMALAFFVLRAKWRREASTE
jgi:hypothetical protein